MWKRIVPNFFLFFFFLTSEELPHVVCFLVGENKERPKNLVGRKAISLFKLFIGGISFFKSFKTIQLKYFHLNVGLFLYMPEELLHSVFFLINVNISYTPS